ncbi:MAG: response regulator [Thermodesulfovibrionales bacterium]|nr:response regulator [Thermodesulfovibrionales bacterium]
MNTENGKYSILVVEDSITQAECLRYILAEQGYTVYVTSNGREALDFLANTKPSLVITDVVMPEINGYELCKAIKNNEDTKNIPVVLLTNLSEPDDVIMGLECGADNFITKPYEREFLLARIRYIIINMEMRKMTSTEMGIEIFFGGKKQFITSNKIQILDLLLSTFENAIQKNKELEEKNIALRKAQENIKRLEGLIPICVKCKKIKDDKGYWKQIEEYLREKSLAEFTHGFCPECLKDLYPDYWDKVKGR